MIKLAELLADEGYTVFIYGQETYFLQKSLQPNIQLCKSLQDCMSASHIIISGMPMSKDGIHLYTPFSSQIISLEIVKELLQNKILIAGMIPEELAKKAKESFDFSLSENLMVLNAIPTVEGILKIAIEETEITLHGANIMVFGYGRIGKILCSRLNALGANVSCVVKKPQDIAWLQEKKCTPILYEKLETEKLYDQIDIIINTVPSLVIRENLLKQLKTDCLIIDVASSPGGVDKEMVKRYKIKVITALGIPGKIAPKTAAQYMKSIIQEKIEK